MPACLGLLLLLLVNPSSLRADSVLTKSRSVTKISDGLYVIRHQDAPDGFPQGNTTIIIGEREVLVVDSCYLPSSARQDIEEIRRLTTKPVRYLLNTHWHYDHTMGNGTYAAEFPQLAIIAQRETARQMEGYNPGWFRRFPQRAVTFKQRIETGKDIDGTPLTESQKRDFAEALAGVEPVWEEFKKIVDRMPNLTFDQELDVDLGNRQVQIKYLGRGNTAGDAIVYLPKEKVLISGDLLDHPVPYLGGGYPFDQVTTLKRMAELEAETIIPGHGDVLRGSYGKSYLKLVIDFLQTVTSHVSLEIYRVGNGPRNLEAVRAAVLKEIGVEAWRKRFAGDDKDNGEFFDGFSLQGVITAAYAQAWGR